MPGSIQEIVAYCRVSTDEQRVHGLGLEAQLTAIQDYAHQTRGSIVSVYREVATGRRDTLRNRPELVKALAHEKRSGALLVFARWDRLSRNVSVTAQLLESSVDFVACDNPYANRLTIHILAAMAEYESKLKSERIKAVFALMRARGHVFPPGKFSEENRRRGNECSVIANRARTKAIYADLLPLILEMRKRGDTLAGVAAQLNGLGHKNQRRNPWSAENVWMLLRREGYSELAKRRADPEGPGHLNRLRARQCYAEFSPSVVKQYERGKTTRQIAGWLNNRGYKTSQWGIWTTPMVVALLRREGVPIRPITREQRRGYIRRGAIASKRNTRARTRAAYAAARPTADRLRAKGKTYDAIAETLNKKKLCSSSGRPWNGAKVWTMINRRRALRSRVPRALRSELG